MLRGVSAGFLGRGWGRRRERGWSGEGRDGGGEGE